MRVPLLLIGSIVIFSGCATKPVEYYYGNYSQTLYRSKKDETPETLAKHKKTLLEIIQTSTTKGYRVPPGIYLEYGYLLAKDGDKEADRYFSLEATTYPESAKFVAFVRSQINAPKT